jgi:hypothetical protein
MNLLNLSKIVPKEILTKSGNKQYQLNVSLSGETILISITKDKHKDIWYPKWIKVPNNSICLWYSWPSGRNRSQNINSGRRYKYLLLPKLIPLDKLTLNALGLLEAEMTKGNLRKSNLSFTNSEPEVINTVMRFFRRFGLNKEDWSWSIVSNFKLKNYEEKYQTIEREQKALTYWLKYTSISPKKAVNKFIQYIGNKTTMNIHPKTIITGSLRIDYSNIILFQLIRKILIDIRNILTAGVVSYYMQGIIAGEGSIHPSIFGSIGSISVGAIKRKDQEFYVNNLKMLEITSSCEMNCTRVTSLENFLKIYDYDLLQLHPIRRAKFNKHLSNFKQIPKRLKVKYASIRKEVQDEILY